MLSLRRHSTRVACALLLAAVVAVAMLWLLTRSPTARAASQSQLQQQISAGQSQISSLSGAVSAASGHLARLNSSISDLEGQISRIQRDLDAKRTELFKLRSELTAAQTRLGQLEAFEAHAERVLSAQLVGDYESDRPDLISVVLEARGFQDLLERLAFAQRIRKQDVQVVSQVRAARSAVALQATKLGALNERQQQITAQVLTQGNALARVKISLVRQQFAVAHQRSTKAGQLAAVRSHVSDLQAKLSNLQAAAAASPSGSSSSGSGGSAAPAGSGTVSSSGFAFPLPKGSVSPPGTWSLDQGVDMAAPGNTPEYAVCSGTIVLHGIGGFGPWAPVLHCDSPLSAGSYVYYGHAGPLNQLPIGTHVSAGQAMSSIGPGIVGISTGPHIEIGFCDSSGSPLGGGTASQMMALLQSSYAG